MVWCQTRMLVENSLKNSTNLFSCQRSGELCIEVCILLQLRCLSFHDITERYILSLHVFDLLRNENGKFGMSIRREWCWRCGTACATLARTELCHPVLPELSLRSDQCENFESHSLNFLISKTLNLTSPVLQKGIVLNHATKISFCF